jgi:hypothetical protein
MIHLCSRDLVLYKVFALLQNLIFQKRDREREKERERDVKQEIHKENLSIDACSYKHRVYKPQNTIVLSLPLVTKCL